MDHDDRRFEHPDGRRREPDRDENDAAAHRPPAGEDDSGDRPAEGSGADRHSDEGRGGGPAREEPEPGPAAAPGPQPADEGEQPSRPGPEGEPGEPERPRGPSGPGEGADGTAPAEDGGATERPGRSAGPERPAQPHAPSAPARAAEGPAASGAAAPDSGAPETGTPSARRDQSPPPEAARTTTAPPPPGEQRRAEQPEGKPTSPRTALRAVLAGGPPPGPARPEFWRSPLRGPWLTSVLGLVLLVGLVVVIVTGFLSYAAYNPGLASINDKTDDADLLGFYLFSWPTSPYWLYRLTQGLHVIGGLVLIPVLLAKLWSVIPRLFSWPPVRSVNHALERLSLLFLVGGALFEFATGVLNVQLEYIFPGSFYPLHFYGAWIFVAALIVHVALRVGKIRRALRGRSLREELRTPTARTEPEEPDDSGLVSPAPARPTLSRRGLLAMTGLGSVVMLGVTVGQSIGGPLRETALLAPRGQDPGPGPNGFQINKTASFRGIREQDVGPDWRLSVRGAPGVTRLSREDLLGMPQHTAHLPIACVEGWSTGDQAWTGVRLADLAALAGHETDPPEVFVESLQLSGSFRAVVLRDNQVRDPRSLLALRVNGADLSMDHGFPARVIVPAAPGVMNTKWVNRLTFGSQATEVS